MNIIQVFKYNNKVWRLLASDSDLGTTLKLDNVLYTPNNKHILQQHEKAMYNLSEHPNNFEKDAIKIYVCNCNIVT